MHKRHSSPESTGCYHSQMREFLKGKRMKQRRRKVSGKTSVGKHSQKVFKETWVGFARRFWILMIILCFGPIIAYGWSIKVTHGFERGFFVGAASVSGPFICVIFVLVFSGASNSYLGRYGELSTAEILRKFEKSGWLFVNGLRLKPNSDIDHVIVGPAGVFLLETKWSAEAWPISGTGKSFMKKRINDTVQQVKRNSYDLQNNFKSTLYGVEVHPVCVLWSLQDSPDSTWIVRDEVTIVPGFQLEAWMREQTEVRMTPKKIKEIWSALEAKVLSTH